MGRPKKPIDWSKVDDLCGIVCTEAEIVSLMKVGASTLARACEADHGMTFEQYYKIKTDGAKSSLRRAQYKLAMAGNPTMLIWLGKQMLGQKDRNDWTGTLQVTYVDSIRQASIERAVEKA